MVAPALGGEKHTRPDERGEIVNDILPAPRIGQPRDHPTGDAAALHDLAQHHDTGITGQPLRTALDTQGLVEPRGDRL